MDWTSSESLRGRRAVSGAAVASMARTFTDAARDQKTAVSRNVSGTRPDDAAPNELRRISAETCAEIKFTARAC